MAISGAQLAVPHFSAPRFDKLLTDHGQTANLYRGIACACIDPAKGSPDPGCTVCEGNGAHFYSAPETVRVQATRKLQRDLERAGTYMPGEAEFTFLSSALVKLFDKFTLPNDRIVVDELLVKRDTNPLTAANREQLRHATVLSVERAETVERSGSGYPYTSTAIPLVEGTHFTRTGRQITWTVAGDGVIADGEVYSIRYVTHPTWVIWSPRQRAENNVTMPPTYVCKRLDMIERSQG